MKIKISKNAEKHLDNIFDFICKENEKAAIDTYYTILDEIDFLAKQPKIAAKELLLDEFPRKAKRLSFRRVRSKAPDLHLQGAKEYKNQCSSVLSVSSAFIKTPVLGKCSH